VRLSTLLLIASAIPVSLAAVLFVPPLRDKVFTTKLWPWPLPFDTSAGELELIKQLAEPGDVIVEANLHGWQWIALCSLTVGSSWVHAALVDGNKRLITVEREVINTDFDIYLKWASTRLAIIRPAYENGAQINRAISYAASQIGVKYDPSFKNPIGNCNGLVGSALSSAGVPVKTTQFFGTAVYSAGAFFDIPGASVVWNSDLHR